MIRAITLFIKFKRAHIRILIIGLILILISSALSIYTTEEIFAMFLKDRYQLIVVHVLINLLISVLLIIITWQINKHLLGDAFDRLNIQNQLWFAMRYFFVYGLVSIFALLVFWLHTAIGSV